MKQGTEEWKQFKLGLVSASRIGDLMARTKSGPSASRKNYMMELLCQRLTGEREEGFTSPAMQWGIDTEPLARAEYEAITGNWVDEIGFICHPTIPMFGVSPDGLVGDDGGIEIKCPNTATHIDTYLNWTIKKDYIYQMQTLMSCTGRQWCDFVSYDPRLPEDIRIKIIRVNRDEEMIAGIEESVIEFNRELDELIERLKDENTNT